MKVTVILQQEMEVERKTLTLISEISHLLVQETMFNQAGGAVSAWLICSRIQNATIVSLEWLTSRGDC